MAIEMIACCTLTFIFLLVTVFLLRRPRDLTFQPVDMTPSEMSWHDHISSYHHGVQIADLVGHEKETGPYAKRVKLPKNFIQKPHYHLERARTITIISGTLYLAYGDKYDESRLKAFPPGSFITEPRKVSHFVVTKSEEVVLQVCGIGPSKSVYLDNILKN